MNRQLQIIDSEDANDVLIEIEKSLQLNFDEQELINVSNLGQLCDVISEKIKLENVQDCTSQQAFYKIHHSLSEILNLNSKSIHLDSRLDEIIPRKNRIKIIQELNERLGFETKLLMISKIHLIIISTALIISFILTFFNFYLGWILFGIFAVCMKGIYDFRKEFNLNTVRDLVEKCVRSNYMKTRRNSNSFNKLEIEKLVINTFNYRLGTKENFTRESIFK